MPRDVITSLHELVEVDFGLYPQVVKHVHRVLDGDIASGALFAYGQPPRPDTDESTMLIPI
jgi:hypothetical protein